MKKYSIGTYLYADSMAIEGTRPDFLTRNQGSTLFADWDSGNAIVTHNFWRENRLIVVDLNRPRHFRLEVLDQEHLLALSET